MGQWPKYFNKILYCIVLYCTSIVLYSLYTSKLRTGIAQKPTRPTLWLKCLAAEAFVVEKLLGTLVNTRCVGTRPVVGSENSPRVMKDVRKIQIW